MPEIPSDPIAALLAAEVPEDYRETVAVLRERAERARDELARGKHGPAMGLHIADGLGHPDAAIWMLDMLDQLAAALPARQEEVKAIQAMAENAPKVAKFVEATKAFINQRPDYIASIENGARGEFADYWQGHADARRMLAERLNLSVPHNPGETTEPRKADADA